ncbi:MAG: AAA family ATPase [Elusimicrobia bacterium]|nr:AAA family ATPase [Elusimicrobiota bacterium]
MENTGKNLFVTGKAGTGKSTLLQYFRLNTQKKVVVLAPTGVAALNVNGETIHSFFGFKPGITIKKVDKLKRKNSGIYQEIDAIIIDEISMVRADLLDCVNLFLRLKGRDSSRAFGGVQMIFIGDLYQLPPVVKDEEKEMMRMHYESPYFFDAKVFEYFSMEFIELGKIYRQEDENFISLLNSIRNNSISYKQIATLNERLGFEFTKELEKGFAVHLTTTNKMALEINNERLNELGAEVATYQAQVSGDFNDKSYPTDYELKVGRGAQIMMLNNDSSGRWVNGSVGKIVDIRPSNDGMDVILVELANGRTEEVLPHVWEVLHYKLNENTHTIDTETAGTFTQHPMKLAWAITIHKSQGKTFDRVIIDIGTGTFAHGQMYVALSRCVSLEGVSLKKPIKKSHILMDWKIREFMERNSPQN